ncbi:MAG: glycosyltransferase [Opitutales bacterium]|nr:glycosyltransferase [Opitutales bacterium]
MRVNASIVLYKTDKEELRKIIDCFVNSSIKCCSLFLIDNSPDLELSSIAHLSDFIEYIHAGENVGYGAGHNIAIRRSLDLGVDYHIVLNSDISFTDKVIEKIAAFMECNLDVGHVMPKITYPNGDLQYLCKLVPTPMDLLIRRFIPDCFAKNKRDLFELRGFSYDDIADVPYLSGCFMVLRINALKEIGLFDERFFMYPEDIDLTRRIAEKYRTVYYPFVSIVHDHAKGSYKTKKMLWIHLVNMVRYFNKWGWIFDSKRRQLNKRTLSALGL